MNLYSNKQKWKIVLMIVALVLVAVSLYASNSIVQGVSSRERLRARQWADAIRKKAELVEFTDNTFTQLREYERKRIKLWVDATSEISRPIPGDPARNFDFPLSIINDNKDIPVIIMADESTIYGFNNLDFDEKQIAELHPEAPKKQVTKLFEDSLIQLTRLWGADDKVFRIEVVEGLTMSYFYTDSKRILQLQAERDSLIEAFNRELINDSRLVPVILYDEVSDSLLASNMPQRKINEKNLRKTMASLSEINDPIVIRIGNANESVLYYDASYELKLLQYYPYIQFLIVGLFVFIGYLMFNTFRKAEQNQVWAGMAKETAHQLGTPLSSLMAWIQLLEAKEVDQDIVREMQKDVERLDTVSQRFSKIGSVAQLKSLDIQDTIARVVDYLRPRISAKIAIELIAHPEPVMVHHNPPLMEWVMENIMKNAVDAMESSGKITVEIKTTPERAHVEITDTGKGLQPKQFKTIFNPGVTTKKRGWGLGLSLVRRIVRDYHKGKVYVLRSEPGKGTTFRISLPLD
jgi:two-component system, sporulation sensor kinase D